MRQGLWCRKGRTVLEAEGIRSGSDDFEFELVTALKRMRDAGVPLRVWRDHIEAIVRALKRSESVWVVTDGTELWTARLADDAAILANGRYRVWVVRIK